MDVKKVKVLLLATLVAMMGLFGWSTVGYAENQEEQADLSYLMTEDALIGYMGISTRGVYLVDGISVINDAGNNTVGAGGITSAARLCKVAVTAIVEKYDNGGWERVTSMFNEKEDALSVFTSKYVKVSSGYYYRCRCTHYAGTDVGYSYTNSLRM